MFFTSKLINQLTDKLNNIKIPFIEGDFYV